MSWKKGELLRITGLYLLIVPFLNVLNASAYENQQIQGHFGVSSTTFMYMNLVPVFVLIAGLPLALELAKQFKLRSLIYSIILLSILLNTGSIYSPNFIWFILFRSLLAFFSILGIFAAIVPIVMHYNPNLNMAVMYGIIQFIIQGSSHLYKYLGANFAHIYDWRTSLMLININFLFCFVLALIFIKKDVAPFKQAFRFDFRGWFLILLFLAPIVFFTAEGQIREWYNDSGIGIATAMLIIVAAIYLLHAKFCNSALINLAVYKYRNVVIGTLFFFFIGILNNTGSIITGFMSGILGFDDLYQARSHLAVLLGVSISIPVCTFLLFHRVYLRVTAIAGFLAFGLYHLLMYYRFQPGITIKDFLFPLMIKGVGIGFLYVFSSLYISEKVPKSLSTSRMMSGILARNVFAILLGSAVLSTFITKLNLLHSNQISAQIHAGNPLAIEKYTQMKSLAIAQGASTAESDRMADNALRSDINNSARILAYKDIYLAIALLSLLPVLLIFLLRLGNRPLQKVEVEPIPI